MLAGDGFGVRFPAREGRKLAVVESGGSTVVGGIE